MTIKELYKLDIETLLKMAREKGVNFPNNYKLPYFVKEMRCSKKDAFLNYHLLDKDISIEEYDEPGEIYIWNIKTSHGVFRRFRRKENAESEALFLNKRHIICAMQSENPKFPVLI